MKFMPYLAGTLLALAATGCGAAPNHQAGHGVGKPGAVVEVQVQSNLKLATGATLALPLKFKAGRANATLEVEYRVEGDLALETPSRVQLTANPGGIASDTPTVRALADGVHYLNVVVTRDQQSRVISIPITVGTAAPSAKPAGKAVTTPQGESLVILPGNGGKR